MRYSVDEVSEQCRLYKETVAPMLSTLAYSARTVLSLTEQISHRDLLFWAALMGHADLIRVVWRHTPAPIHFAAIAARMCEVLAQRLPSSNVLGKDDLRDKAQMLER